MCRYADHNYRSSFACLKHRHVAQAPKHGDHPLCPTCRVPMVEMERDFAAPRKESDRQWAKLELLVARARERAAKTGRPMAALFDGCGCGGYGKPRIKTLGQARHPLL